MEFYADNAADAGDYLIGEKIDINGDGTPLRYMDQPTKDGSSADYWAREPRQRSTSTTPPASPTTSSTCCPRAAGRRRSTASSYDSPDLRRLHASRASAGTKAYQIWYRALTVYMTSTTDYAGARAATLKAATDLFGADSEELKAVSATWTGVNVK